MAEGTDELESRLAETTSDRASTARDVALETAGILRDWLVEWPDERGRDGARIEASLASWSEQQGWRGPCAVWLDCVRRAFALADPDAGDSAERLIEEMDLWLREGEDVRTGAAAPPRRRLPSRAELAERAGLELSRGDTVLVTAWSETVFLALEAAWRAGRRPRVSIGEGSPNLDGRRMARALVRAGIPVTMVYDAALLALVPRVDCAWLATEAIGAGAFVARTGTRALLDECARYEVPTRLLATSDKLVPGGALRLPTWSEKDTWLLWEDAPEGVRLESQAFELTPLDLVDGISTEIGRESAADLHLRALRVDSAPACGSRTARETSTVPVRSRVDA